jgi:predicted nuclease of restriction endonuclease-like (RecB) superfamily
MKSTPIKISGIGDLVHAIQNANKFFLTQVQRQVNTSLTLRNWLVGYYMVEYEQNGADRAEYGDQLVKNLSQRLKKAGVKGLGISILNLCRQFYDIYPQIFQTLSGFFQINDNQRGIIFQSPTGKSPSLPPTPVETLLGKLSFSHFAELLKADTPLRRLFYETETIRNNWSVRELRRAMDSLLFERTGLSKDKESVLEKHRKGSGLQPADVFRDPYLLDFLGLSEKTAWLETDLEQAIIDHLQKFLLEMGRGFCFEARQKRLTLDNTHYRIDLVFYHRLLRCHILIDLKMGRFTAADAGQMHMYLNYFKENEATEGDNPPIGIILCTDKSETLVKYATSGLSQNVFVSKYMTSLPSEQELQKVVDIEREKATG